MPKIPAVARNIQKLPFRLLLIFVLAAVVFFDAEAGRLLGIKMLPLHFSVVWPATGFSLAALLLFGYSIWPGIFIGNFCYNFLHLYLNGSSFIGPFFAASAITLGSLIQALVAALIIRNRCSYTVFNTVKDVFIFLLAGGIFTCMIAATVGVVTLTLYEGQPLPNTFYTWVTFWLGDTMGVYIFTPLIIVWVLQKPAISVSSYSPNIVYMALAGMGIFELTFVKNYPLAYLFIPYSIWVTYRFGMHGATLIVFLISLFTIIPTSLGIGTFVVSYSSDPLLILVTFLVIIIVVTSLVVAAVLNEREAASKQIESHRQELEKEVGLQKGEIQLVTRELSIQEKMASLSKLMQAFSTEIQLPLKEIENLALISTECLKELQEKLRPLKEKIDPDLALSLEDNFVSLEIFLRHIGKTEAQMAEIAKVIEGDTQSFPKRIQVNRVDISSLLDQCLSEVAQEEAKKSPGFTPSIRKEFDRAIDVVLGVPADLKYAFVFFLRKAHSSMKEKMALLGQEYTPLLELSTVNHPDEVEIIIRDNGLGVTEEELAQFFKSFIEVEELTDSSDLGLAYAHDVIVHVHQGKIDVDTQEKEYLELRLFLSKT